MLQHARLNYRWQQTQDVYRWRFEEDGRALDVAVEAGLTVDDTGILREAVLCGMGLACLPDRLVAPLVEAGRLVRVLEEFCPAQPGFFLYYPLNGHPSAALKAFIGFVRAAGVRQ
ncbi:LysR substrate-binding domain-containing protein [Martelella sp. FLE1502]